MRPLRTRLQEARRRLGIPWEVLELDYVLSWVLAGISQTPALRDTLAFKGGTALSKCYFEDYRFSEDLDFTGIGAVPGDKDLEDLVRAGVCGRRRFGGRIRAGGNLLRALHRARATPRRSGSVHHPGRDYRGRPDRRPGS